MTPAHYVSGMTDRDPPGSQRRNAARRAKRLLCGSGQDPRLFGPSRDVSNSGAFVEWEVRPPLGEVVDVTFAWRDELCSCKARVVRYGPDGVGLSFVDPSPRARSVLARLLASTALS